MTIRSLAMLGALPVVISFASTPGKYEEPTTGRAPEAPGKTVYEASDCVNGGRLPGRTWVDSEGDDCDGYVSNNWCPKYENYGAQSIKPKEACCVCGGGRGRVCVDVKDWKDSDGDDCAKYESKRYCTLTDGVPRYGDWGKQAMKPKEACCVCGGGTLFEPCGATIPSGKQFASGKTATSPCGSDGCDACFEDIPKCGPPGVGKQFASGKSATTPCGTNCGACFEDKFPKPFNSPWFCTDRPDDPKDPSKCSTFFYDKDSEYVTSMSEYGDMNFLRNPLQYDYDKKAGGSVAKAIKHDARDRKAPKGIEKYEHNTMCGLDSCGVGVYVVTPQEIEVGKSFSANVFADMRHVPGNIQVGHFKVTYPTALYEVLGWEYGAFPKDSLLGTVIPCGETLSCREIDDGTSAAQIIEHPDVG